MEPGEGMNPSHSETLVLVSTVDAADDVCTIHIYKISLLV